VTPELQAFIDHFKNEAELRSAIEGLLSRRDECQGIRNLHGKDEHGKPSFGDGKRQEKTSACPCWRFIVPPSNVNSVVDLSCGQQDGLGWLQNFTQGFSPTPVLRHIIIPRDFVHHAGFGDMSLRDLEKPSLPG
jgi:hypothetical protein